MREGVPPRRPTTGPPGLHLCLCLRLRRKGHVGAPVPPPPGGCPAAQVSQLPHQFVVDRLHLCMGEQGGGVGVMW